MEFIDKVATEADEKCEESYAEAMNKFENLKNELGDIAAEREVNPEWTAMKLLKSISNKEENISEELKTKIVADVSYGVSNDFV